MQSQAIGSHSFVAKAWTLEFSPSLCSFGLPGFRMKRNEYFGHILWKSWTYFLEIFIDIESRDKSTQNHVLDCALLLNSIAGQLVPYTGGEIADPKEGWFHTGYLLRPALTIY